MDNKKLIDELQYEGFMLAKDRALRKVLTSLNDAVESGAETPDWSENDPTSKSYIKDRTHYKEIVTTPVVIGGADAYATLTVAESPEFQDGDKVTTFVLAAKGQDARTINLINAISWVAIQRDNLSNPSAYPYDLLAFDLRNMPTTSTVTCEVPAASLAEGGGYNGYKEYILFEIDITIHSSGFDLNYHATPLISSGQSATPECIQLLNVNENFNDYNEFVAWIKPQIEAQGYTFKSATQILDSDNNYLTHEECVALVNPLIASYEYKFDDSQLALQFNVGFYPGWEEQVYLRNLSEDYINNFTWDAGHQHEVGDSCYILAHSRYNSSQQEPAEKGDGVAFTLVPFSRELIGDTPWTSEQTTAYAQAALFQFSAIGVGNIYEGSEQTEVYHKLDPNFLPEGSGGGGAKQTLVFGPNMTFNINNSETWVNGTAAQVAAALDISEEDLEKLVTFQYDFVEFPGDLATVLEVSPGPVDWFKADGEFRNIGVVLGWGNYIYNANAGVVSAVNDLIAGNTPSEIPHLSLACVAKHVDKNGNVEYGVYDYNN